MQQPTQPVTSTARKPWRTLVAARARFERRYLVAVLRRTKGQVTLAAQLAGRDRSAFSAALKRYNIRSKDFRRCAPRSSCTRSAEPSALVTTKRDWFGVPLQ